MTLAVIARISIISEALKIWRRFKMVNRSYVILLVNTRLRCVIPILHEKHCQKLA
jgi:hypothetical protein